MKEYGTNVMDELIPIKETNGKKAVNARDLHLFLGSKRDFSTWIKDRICKYDFIDGVDFQSFPEIVEREIGATTRIEYALSISMAKELSMIENNEQGRKARKYFIECESVLKNGGFQIPSTFSEALLLASNQAKQIEEQQKKIESDKPKVLFADAVSSSRRSCLVAELAKILQQNGVNIGQNRLFTWMRKNGYLCSKGQYYNQPTQKAMELGLFELKQTSITKSDGVVLVTTTTKVTGKGQIYFVEKFLSK